MRSRGDFAAFGKQALPWVTESFEREKRDGCAIFFAYN